MTACERELLELAAKAAGLSGFWVDAGLNTGTDARPLIWNPFGDGGDALRLAVELKIDVKHYGDHVVAWFDGGFIGTGRIPYASDPNAATRCAIVLAAAAIGRAMP